MQKFLAWIIWLLSALFMFYKYAIEVSPSIMTTELMSTFKIDATAMGNLAACYFYSYLIMQIPAGILIDRFGPRRVTTLAILTCGLGAFLFAQAETFAFASIGRFLSGLGAAFAAVNCLKLTGNWFPANRFAYMAGLMMTVGMLGAVGGQAPLASLNKALHWRHAMEVIGVGGMILGVLFWLIVRDKAKSHKVDKALTPKRMSLIDSCKHILKNKQSWWLSVYSGFAFAPVSIFGGLWGVSFIAESYQINQHVAAQAVSLIFIGFAVGAPVFGWYSDRVGLRKPVMFWGTLVALFCISAVIYLPMASSTVLNLLLFLFGFSISSFLLCFSMIREINMPIVAATAIGFMNTFDALFGAFSDPMTGKFLDMNWGGKIVDGARIFSVGAYKLALLTIPVYLVIALISLLWIKETRCKPSYPVSMP